jgi:hypothetical protein
MKPWKGFTPVKYEKTGGGQAFLSFHKKVLTNKGGFRLNFIVFVKGAGDYKYQNNFSQSQITDTNHYKRRDLCQHL